MKFYVFVSFLILSFASARDYLDDWNVDTDGIRNSVIEKLNDGIHDCKDETSTHYKFVSCVKKLVEKTNGLNSDEEDDIIEAARDSNVHRRSNDEDEDSEDREDRNESEDEEEDREDRNEDKDEDDKEEDQEGKVSSSEDEKSPDDSEDEESSSNGKRYLRSFAAKSSFNST